MLLDASTQHSQLTHSASFPSTFQSWKIALGAFTAAAAAWVLGCVALLCIAPVYILFLPFIELVFYVCWYRRKHRQLEALLADHHVSQAEAWIQFNRMCAVLKDYQGAQDWVSQWFHGAAPHRVRRDNVVELLAYTIWFQTRDEVHSSGHGGDLEEMMGMLEAVLGRRFAAGYNASVSFMAHLNEPLPHLYRPATFYVAAEFVAWVGHRTLCGAGFRRHVIDGMAHYVRPASASFLAAQRKAGVPPVLSRTAPAAPGVQQQQPVWRWFWPPSWKRRHVGRSGTLAGHGSHRLQQQLLPLRADEDAAAAPLVFLHGVGLGLLPYMKLLLSLAMTGAPMVALEFKHISMRWTHRVPSVSDLAMDVKAVLDLHGYRTGTLVAHSFGTAVAACFVQFYPERTHQVCLLDPICFNIFIPTVLQNFVYRKLTWKRWWLDLLMLAPALELHCSAGMCRRFIWTHVNMWPEHMPSGCFVLLGGQDDLIPAEEMHRWLQENTDANVLFYPHMFHGEVLVRNRRQLYVVHQILMAAYGVQRHDSARSYLHSLEGPNKEHKVMS